VSFRFRYLIELIPRAFDNSAEVPLMLLRSLKVSAHRTARADVQLLQNEDNEVKIERCVSSLLDGLRDSHQVAEARKFFDR
jgi:hypothetical protein